MKVQIKTFLGIDRGNHVIAIADGVVDINGFGYIFDRLIEATRALLDCKILVDFQDSSFKILPADVTAFVGTFECESWPHNNKVALVCSADTAQYRQLIMLGEGLLKLNLKAGIFYDSKEAISWLADLR
jgi:hypothetical protein